MKKFKKQLLLLLILSSTLISSTYFNSIYNTNYSLTNDYLEIENQINPCGSPISDEENK